MFWRFGFNKASSIDSLLDKEDVSLEAILDEDELLQECKAQNTRLNDYFQRVDVLQKLLGYVTGQIEGEEKGRFKYPYVATEVLCSEIWSIVETCINHKEQLLVPFWETVLDRSTEDMKTQVAMASHFAKVNAVFLNKKPNEMLAFIQAQPSVVERILRHVETPSFVDLLVRILQLDERCTGVLEWLSSEQLMARLIEFLSPAHSSDVHTIVAELIKGIISMATPSPGAGLTEGLQNGPASNRFARELAHRDSVTKLAGYMLHDFGSDNIPSNKDETSEANNGATTSSSSKLPNLQSSASSVVNSISIIIELIRKNNSDYFEPFLFHTLRNRLIVVQQQLGSQAEDGRETLEQAMKEMVDRMGVVHLGPVLEIIGEKLDQLQGFLRKPRSLTGEMSTTVGTIVPLTFERYRICELFAELLHCSNMSLLNRHQADHLYDSEGRLLGGLSGLEELSKVIAANSGDDRDRDAMDEGNDEIEPALELPVTSTRNSPSSLDSDDDIMDEPGSSDDDAMEEIVMHDEPSPRISSSPSPTDLELEQPPMIVPSSPNAASLPPPTELAAQGAALSRAASFGSNSDSDTATIAAASHGSRRNSRRATTMDSLTQAPLPIGERLKRRYLDIGILSTLLDLFFEFPWNNFLHSAVYDLIHQILTGNVDRGLNRELAIALFRDARLMHRIVEGQKRNDAECAKPKGVRLGYMGHLTLIAADVITALERFPPDLQLTIVDFAPQTWDDYVTGRYNEAKMNEARLLGGGKPVLSGDSARGGGSQWKIDEADSSSAAAISEASSGAAQERTRGEFRRSSSLHPSRESSADFGPADIVNEEGDSSNQASTPTFVSFDLHSASNYGSSGSDDDDEDGGWLSRSEFALGNASLASRRQDFERRPLSGFDDVFNPHNSSDDPFSSADDDDDGFGPFSDSAPASGTDPFTFGSSFSDEMEDSAFESFGDFGDFQSSGELTPTGDSWTFASDSSISEGSDGSANSPRNTESPEEESRQSSTSNSSTR